MRYASFIADGRPGWGRVEDEHLVELTCDAAPDLKSALAAGHWDFPAGATHALAGLRLAPVVPNPGKILCVGHNYEEHRVETNGPRVGHPSIFTRFADTLTGHDAAVAMPAVSTMLDYEGELAVVIGRGGRAIAESEAMAHVAGYTCANDVSVRDWQKHTGQFTPGKNFAGTCPLGPWLVTPDAIADLGEAQLTTRLNGAIMQQAHIAQQIFPIPVVIAYISTFTALSPGDIILTGTPGGVGARRDPPVWMRPGDLVEIEISAIGTLSNRVVAE